MMIVQKAKKAFAAVTGAAQIRDNVRPQQRFHRTAFGLTCRGRVDGWQASRRRSTMRQMTGLTGDPSFLSQAPLVVCQRQETRLSACRHVPQVGNGMQYHADKRAVTAGTVTFQTRLHVRRKLIGRSGGLTNGLRG